MAVQSVSQLILKTLGQQHLLSAPELVEQLHRQGRTVNKTSVYRALDKLLEQNLLCQHNLQDDSIVYELRTDHHDHIVCTSCGRIQKADCPVTIPTNVSGYLTNHHHLTLYGICPSCQGVPINPTV